VRIEPPAAALTIRSDPPVVAVFHGEGFLAADAIVVTPLEQLASRVAELEAALAALVVPAHGIGHNNPPLSDAELDEIRREILLLKTRPLTPADARASASQLSKLAECVGAWLAARLTIFADAALTEAGKSLVRWLIFYMALSSCANAIYHWLTTLQQPALPM
jgi:hypothetical protein